MANPNGKGKVKSGAKSQTRVIKKGDPVTLRARLNKDGSRETLYLDYFLAGKRKYKFLDYYLFVNAKDQFDKKHNEENLSLAKEERRQFEADLTKKKNGVPDTELINALFLPYFNKCKDKPTKEGKKKELGTKQCYDSVEKLLIEFGVEGKTFKEIDKKFCSEFRAFLIDRVSRNTASLYWNKFTYSLNQAIKDEIIKDNPLVSVDGISMKKKPAEFLTFDQLIKLKETECDSDVIKKACLFMSRTGMRAGDIKKLQFKQFGYTNELGHYIRFEQKKTTEFEYHRISDEAVKIIGEFGKPEDFVFPGFDNKGYGRHLMKLWVARAGIQQNIKFHTFRHSYAVELGVSGANLFEISKMLGHKDIQTTQGHYAKVIDSTKRKLADSLRTL
jgi:integrase